MLVGLEGLVLLGLGGAGAGQPRSDRVALAVTTGLFFVGLGAGLLVCARGLSAAAPGPAARSSLVQLIALLLSSSFWGGETTWAPS